MEISKIKFVNFRQYYGNVEINLFSAEKKNVTVIGGLNGYGKTNFLVGLVWCLYGSNISNVDEIFRQQVRGGYSRFLLKALNWNAKQDGLTTFSVSIQFDNVELSEGFNLNSKANANVLIKREYDTLTGNEDLLIQINDDELELMKENDEKHSFINDYIVPIQAAKFVFFDAEKIADIAELNLTEQGRIMNEALGKLLGLDTYEGLVGDLEIYRKNLKKECANKDIYDQIEAIENKRKLNNDRLKELNDEIDNIDELIFNKQREISDIDRYLSDHSITTNEVDLSHLYTSKKDLEEQKAEVSVKFFDHLEIIPFCISAGKIQELITQLKIEEEIKSSQYEHDDFIDKSNLFVENLFNKEPYPESDISIKQKMFYLEKAEKLISRIFFHSDENNTLLFEHDLSRSDINNIFQLYESLKQSNDEKFENLYKEIIRIENELNRVNNEIRKAEGEIVNEEIHDLKRRKNEFKHQIDELNIEKGKKLNEKITLEQENSKLDSKIETLLSKVEISKGKKSVLDDVTKYIDLLNDFINSEKKEKHRNIEENILHELSRLMHKKLINKVKVRIIPDNKGLEVSLFDSNNKEIHKEDLSKGEQQLYVSCLLKAILNESISDLPVFIDTPLGRLDIEHKENILRNYYPTLANQVVIFSLDDEITPKRLETIRPIISQTFLLENQNGNTNINLGYFNYVN